jgi:hypothetical protein
VTLPNEVSQNAYSMVVNTSYESDLQKSDNFLISLRKLFSKSKNQMEKQTITTIKVRERMITKNCHAISCL